MGTSHSKSASNFVVPDIDSMPSSDRLKAIEDAVASINEQRIVFGFRQVEPDSHGQDTLKSVASCMRFLPEYAIRIEGHSNLAKSEGKLTSQDKARIQKLSQDRAEACARLLKAAGVKNDIACVGRGALRGQPKGCVQLVLFRKWQPPTAKTNEQLQGPAVEPDLEKTQQVITVAADVGTVAPGVATKEFFKVDAQDAGAKDPKTSDPEEMDVPDQSSALIEPLLNPADVDMKAVEPASTESVPSKKMNINSFSVVVEPEDPDKKSRSEAPAAAAVASAQAEQWGTTHIPWFIACCTQSTRPKTDECPMQGLPVKQMQILLR